SLSAVGLVALSPAILALACLIRLRMGKICVLDMGEPVKIVDLARSLILLSGLKPDEDIKIEFTGMRPGEKLYEELSTMLEDTAPTAHEKMRVYVGNGMPDGDMAAWINHLGEICETRDAGPAGHGAERDRSRLQSEHEFTKARHRNSGPPRRLSGFWLKPST